MQGMDDAAVVRHQDFECDAPVEVVVELGAGRLDVRLVEGETGARAVAVQVLSLIHISEPTRPY